MRTHSTGALSPQRREDQEKIYRGGHVYDVLVIGTGMAALSVAALLAYAGRRVCMLEAHDVPGGYAHTFRMGDYHFCAQIHYIWGCAPGEKIHCFLQKLGLERDITFVPLEAAGYDHVVLPDGRRVRLPYGYDRLADNIELSFPGQGTRVRAFTHILDRLSSEVNALPERPRWWQALTQGWRFLSLLEYRDKTLQQVFDECALSPEAQAVLIANSGNFMCPPRELSILAYNGLFSGYNRGAYYPARHFKYMVDRLASFITGHPGCHIFFETEAVRLPVEAGRVARIETRDGKSFTAETVICNADPQWASHAIGREKFPADYLPALSYDYSLTALTVYLGLRGIDLRDHGFGRHNTWHLEQWDLNTAWDEEMHQDWSRPWLFLATPSLHTSDPSTCPPGGQILELATTASYDYFKQLRDTDRRTYDRKKRQLMERLLDIVERKYVPGIRDHIALHVVGSPVTNEDYCLAPRGHAYGQSLTPRNMGLGRLDARTPWPNFHWCNAASGYAGVNGTVGTGMKLYTELTGDRFFDASAVPTTEQLHRLLWSS